MSAFTKFNCFVVIGSIFLSTILQAQTKGEVDQWLNELKSPDINVQLTAIRELQTCLDPRIPKACLPLLHSEGNSVRRLALRAIGSRWPQISKDKVPEFVEAVTPHLKEDFPDNSKMAKRAIALLTRHYEPPMTCQSSNKRWVIYERHGFPCLIDTRNGSEELLGFNKDLADWRRIGNYAIESAVFWHAKKEIVALIMFPARHFNTLWVWKNKNGLKVFRLEEMFPSTGKINVFFISSLEWKGDVLEMRADYTQLIDGKYIDGTVKISWDSTTGKFSQSPSPQN